MRIAWLSFLDVNRFQGGGELAQRDLIRVGRSRGHFISESPFFRGRLQGALRRTRIYRRIDVDWDADLFVLSNLRNCPQLGLSIPDRTIQRILSSKRVALVEDAWVDTCELDMPCGGDVRRCPVECDRKAANELFGAVQIAVFVSPMQRRMVQAVLDVPLPARSIIRHPFIDVTRFKVLDRQRDIDFLYVGTISEAKGYRNLVERFDANRLVLAGRWELDGPVLGTYLGEVPYSQLPELYNRARIFAHLPEWFEPMGRTVIEAALCGCEIITNERVGVTSFPRREWTDPALIRGNADRFWTDLERAAGDLR